MDPVLNLRSSLKICFIYSVFKIIAGSLEKVCLPFLKPAIGWAILRTASIEVLVSSMSKVAGELWLIAGVGQGAGAEND